MLLSDLLPNTVRAEGGGLVIACLTAQLADEARRLGCDQMSARIEACLTDVLNALPKNERAFALMATYNSVMQQAPPEPPRLRLVHSRD